MENKTAFTWPLPVCQAFVLYQLRDDPPVYVPRRHVASTVWLPPPTLSHRAWALAESPFGHYLQRCRSAKFNLLYAYLAQQQSLIGYSSLLYGRRFQRPEPQTVPWQKTLSTREGGALAPSIGQLPLLTCSWRVPDVFLTSGSSPAASW